jgi:hypothetical protein
MAQIGKTWAEVLESVVQHGLPWQAMADDQKISYARAAKRYIGDVTADGVRLTWDRLGEAVMTTGDAVKSYFRRSETGNIRSSTATPIEVRRVKSDIAKPGVVDKLLADPKTAAIIAKAATQHEARVEAEVKRQTRERSPELADRAEFNEAAGELLKARRAAGRSLEIAQANRFRKDEREALLDDVLKLANIAGWYEALINGDRVDWDEALKELEA